MFELTGTIALVTGGGSGLGAAIAEGLAAQGAHVAIADLDLARAEEVAGRVHERGGQASAWRLDVSRHAEVEACVAEIAGTVGPIDVLVASAGIGVRRPAVSLSPEDWQRVIDVNLSGCWFCDQAVGRRMIEDGRPGSIINIGSVVGQVGIDTGNANYAASKGGIIGLTKCLAVEWAPAGVRVNVIAPTHFKTPLVEQAIADRPELEQRFLANIPLGRLGEPREIVGAAVFLASDESSMVTGHVLNVDGGHTAR
ncbi:MAG TPA: glucose 1-dehydrogenase [Acidimicrobiales bacterium]|nr:glucose 1-dehydrogenase [Acidimicrobiales bacterium]